MTNLTIAKSTIPVLMGPTGAGKTAAAVQLATAHPGRFEIVNCDSRQLYSGLEITTAAPSVQEMLAVPHHLVSVLQPDQETTAYDYRQRARLAFDEILSRDRIPLMVVGTGFYFKVLRTNLPETGANQAIREQITALPVAQRLESLRRLRPDLLTELGGKIHENDAYRINRALEMALGGGSQAEVEPLPFQLRAFYLDMPVETLVQRLLTRSRSMIDGMIAEIRTVHSSFGDCPGLRALGVDLVQEFLAGRLSREELIEKVWISHRQYAKRQRTWFRREVIEQRGSAVDFVAWARLFVDP
ncbi:MAG: tRNA (adenosine(37)-N6)-dimethylallyltransferase MiaA [Leptospirales bacterium]|nr:tRNA (adenosine(37)-N6)-dimethylallyltransferase MiaA [Leptospirales bacterium]